MKRILISVLISAIIVLCIILFLPPPLSASNTPLLITDQAATKVSYSGGSFLYNLPYHMHLCPVARDSQGNIHLVYAWEEKIFYTKSVDDGLTWSSPECLGQPFLPLGQIRWNGYPAILVGPNDIVHVFARAGGRYYSPDDQEILHKYLKNGVWSEEWTCLAGNALGMLDYDGGGLAIDADGTVHSVFSHCHWTGAQYFYFPDPATHFEGYTQLPGSRGDIQSMTTQVLGSTQVLDNDIYSIQIGGTGQPILGGIFFSKRVAGHWSGPEYIGEYADDYGFLTGINRSR